MQMDANRQYISQSDDVNSYHQRSCSPQGTAASAGHGKTREGHMFFVSGRWFFSANLQENEQNELFTPRGKTEIAEIVMTSVFHHLPLAINHGLLEGAPS